jgi:four helix bundle protein
MTTLRSFEELDAWQNARVLTREIYSATNNSRFSGELALRDQLRRRALSVMTNIAEGFESGGPGHFGRFLSIAKGSSGELRSLLIAALDLRYLGREVAERLMGLCVDTSRLIGGLRRYLQALRTNRPARNS